MTQLTYFEVTGTWEPSSTKGIINGNVTFAMLIQNNGVLAAPTLDNPAVVVPTVVHSSIDNNTLQPVSLLANTAALNLTGTLYYTATFSDVSYRESGKPEAGLSIGPLTFAASTDTTPVNLVNVTPAAGVATAQLASVITAAISDATTLGRQLLTVPDAATALSDLGIGNNADGTMSISNFNVMAPLSTVIALSTNASPAIGVTTVYSPQIAGANLAPTLLPLSSLRVGSRFGVAHDPLNKSIYTFSFNAFGTDQFFPSLKTSGTFPLPGEQREFEVVSVGGVKYWGPAGPLNPVSSLDGRYLVADGGNAQGNIYDGGNAAATGYVSTLTTDGGTA